MLTGFTDGYRSSTTEADNHTFHTIQLIGPKVGKLSWMATLLKHGLYPAISRTKLERVLVV